MFQIIIGVLAVAVMAMLVAGGINYINTDRMDAIAVAHRIDAESNALRSALSAFVVANGHLPEPASWEAQLRPYMPPSGGMGPPQFQWSFGVSAFGDPWICASHPRANPVLLGAADRISASWPADLVLRSRSCGDDEATPAAGEPVAITIFAIDRHAGDEDGGEDDAS